MDEDHEIPAVFPAEVHEDTTYYGSLTTANTLTGSNFSTAGIAALIIGGIAILGAAGFLIYSSMKKKAAK